MGRFLSLFEIVSLKVVLGLDHLLFLRNQSFAEATKLRKQLQEMVTQKKARIVDTMIVVAKNGEKGTTQSLLEYIYPTEPNFEMPSPTSPVNGILSGHTSSLSWLRSAPTPSAFEPRDVGGTLRIEPMLSNDHKIIGLRFDWEIVDHEGENVMLEYKDSLDNTYKIEMPKFFVKHVVTSFTCVPSSYTLVATVDPQNEKGRRDPSRKWLIFAKCEVQYIR